MSPTTDTSQDKAKEQWDANLESWCEAVLEKLRFWGEAAIWNTSGKTMASDLEELYEDIDDFRRAFERLIDSASDK